jgi:hypothetical protein
VLGDQSKALRRLPNVLRDRPKPLADLPKPLRDLPKALGNLPKRLTAPPPETLNRVADCLFGGQRVGRLPPAPEVRWASGPNNRSFDFAARSSPLRSG